MHLLANNLGHASCRKTSLLRQFFLNYLSSIVKTLKVLLLEYIKCWKATPISCSYIASHSFKLIYT